MEHTKDCICWSCFSKREKINDIPFEILEDDEHPFWDPAIVYEDGE